MSGGGAWGGAQRPVSLTAWTPPERGLVDFRGPMRGHPCEGASMWISGTDEGQKAPSLSTTSALLIATLAHYQHIR